VIIVNLGVRQQRPCHAWFSPNQKKHMVKVYDFLKNAYVPDGHEALSDFSTAFEVAEVGTNERQMGDQ